MGEVAGAAVAAGPSGAATGFGSGPAKATSPASSKSVTTTRAGFFVNCFMLKERQVGGKEKLRY